MKHLTLIDKAFLLKRTLPFSALSLDLLLAIADKLAVATFNAGEHVFIAQQEANRMYFIVHGKIEARAPNGQVLALLQTGDFFGEESLFNNKVRGYAICALVNTQVMTLSRTNLYNILSECPSVAIGFLQLYISEIEFRPGRSAEIDT